MKLVPELYCSNIEETRDFYIKVLKFDIKYERKSEKFIYFSKNDIDLMVEQLDGPGRKWLMGSMENPFGRGINFQWPVVNIDYLYNHIKGQAKDSIILDIESKEYICDGEVVCQRQFVLKDPDGYLFRFCD